MVSRVTGKREGGRKEVALHARLMIMKDTEICLSFSNKNHYNDQADRREREGYHPESPSS